MVAATTFLLRCGYCCCTPQCVGHLEGVHSGWQPENLAEEKLHDLILAVTSDKTRGYTQLSSVWGEGVAEPFVAVPGCIHAGLGKQNVLGIRTAVCHPGAAIT